jgi:hypothetical protein
LLDIINKTLNNRKGYPRGSREEIFVCPVAVFRAIRADPQEGAT